MQELREDELADSELEIEKDIEERYLKEPGNLNINDYKNDNNYEQKAQDPTLSNNLLLLLCLLMNKILI